MKDRDKKDAAGRVSALDRRRFILSTAGLAAGTLACRPTLAKTRSNKQAPKITGPVKGGTHGWAFGGYLGEIAEQGYIEEEYFIEGNATAYVPVGTFGSDGRWTVEPGSSAPYKTRLLVRRPRDPAKFNGTVIVEWLNVSFGFDCVFADGQGLYEAGFAYVGVSAQRVGVNGLPSQPQGLAQWDPDRYGTLTVPADAYSYDVFTQAATVLGRNGARRGADPLHGLSVRRLIGVGISQSGGRILTYANAIQPVIGVFHALLPIVSAGASAPLTDGASDAPRGGILFTRVREDLQAKLFQMNTESEALYYVPWRQPDSSSYRYWEVAGASHGPTGQVKIIQAISRRDGVHGHWDDWTQMSEVMWLPTLDAAFGHVHRWLQGGKGPPSQPPISIATVDGKPAYQRDRFGNSIGGVRLPELEVPIARYTGQFGPGGLAGKTEPFSADVLRGLYPTHEDYVGKVTAAARAARDAGVITPYRVDQYIAAAKSASIPV